MAEVIGLCHRAIVMRAGRIAGEVAGAAMTETAIVRYAMGLDDTAREAAHAGA